VIEIEEWGWNKKDKEREKGGPAANSQKENCSSVQSQRSNEEKGKASLIDRGQPRISIRSVGLPPFMGMHLSSSPLSLPMRGTEEETGRKKVNQPGGENRASLNEDLPLFFGDTHTHTHTRARARVRFRTSVNSSWLVDRLTDSLQRRN